MWENVVGRFLTNTTARLALYWWVKSRKNDVSVILNICKLWAVFFPDKRASGWLRLKISEEVACQFPLKLLQSWSWDAIFLDRKLDAADWPLNLLTQHSSVKVNDVWWFNHYARFKREQQFFFLDFMTASRVSPDSARALSCSYIVWDR